VSPRSNWQIANGASLKPEASGLFFALDTAVVVIDEKTDAIRVAVAAIMHAEDPSPKLRANG
jgi:hypothetical protein